MKEKKKKCCLRFLRLCSIKYFYILLLQANVRVAHVSVVRHRCLMKSCEMESCNGQNAHDKIWVCVNNVRMCDWHAMKFGMKFGFGDPIC